MNLDTKVINEIVESLESSSLDFNEALGVM